MGVGCGNVAPSAGLVRSQGLAVLGCGSGLIRVADLAGLGGCDGCGLWLGVFGRSGACWRVRWRPSASGSFGVIRAGPGVAPRGGGWLGNGVRWRRRWLGNQARRAVSRAGLLGCCGCRRHRCADACGVARVCVCPGLGCRPHLAWPGRATPRPGHTTAVPKQGHMEPRRVGATGTCRPPKQVCCTMRHAATRRKGAEVRNARGKGHNGHTTTNKRARPLTSPARIGRGRRETRCVKASRRRDPPNAKRHTKKQGNHETP